MWLHEQLKRSSREVCGHSRGFRRLEIDGEISGDLQELLGLSSGVVSEKSARDHSEEEQNEDAGKRNGDHGRLEPITASEGHSRG